MTRYLPAILALALGVLTSCALLESFSTQAPSLSISHTADLQLPHSTIRLFQLHPTGKPSGELALKIVQDGKVSSAQSFTFSNMTATGHIAVILDPHSLVVALDAKAESVVATTRTTQLPADSVDVSTGWISAQLKQDDPEHIFWHKSIFIGELPSEYSAYMPLEFAPIIELSRETPAIKSYVLTAKIHD